MDLKKNSKNEVSEGAKAPDVSFMLHNGQRFALADAKDKLVFVYFYPKDDTPGCTVEAKGLRDNYPELTAAGITVIGVSLQDAASHQRFIDKYKLPFALAVDDGSIAKAFGVPYQGEFASRQSFLINKGRIARVWRTVTPAGHAEEVLEAVKMLGS